MKTSTIEIIRIGIENAEQITLKMMVQHRSGIPNYTDNPEYWLDEQGNGQNALDFALDLPASFAPDEGYEYSNTNYLLLSRIIEQVTGGSRQEYFKKEILIPLGLNNTFGSLDDVDLDDVMSGYHVGYPHDLKTNDYGMHATAEDVGTFLRALNDGSLFEPGEKEIYDSVYENEHSGWVPGYQSFAKYYKDLDVVAIEFYSTTDPKLYNWNLSEIINKRIRNIIRNKN